MWAARFWANRFWAPRFWPNVGAPLVTFLLCEFTAESIAVPTFANEEVQVST